MAGINLDLVTDTRDIKKGFKDVESALEDVADSLDDVAKDGENATEDLERSFKDLARDTKKEARDMGRDVSKSYDKMADGAGEATKQMKDDAFSNSREVAASFDGSAESIVDGFQGAAAEMFSGFGPAGAAAGLAAAAGLGLVTAELQKQQEEADEAAARVDAMVAQMISAQTTYVTEMDRLNALEAFLGDAEARKEAQELADTLGIPLLDVAQGLFDLNGKREGVEAKIAENYSKQREALQFIGGDAAARLIEETRIRDTMQEQLDIINQFDEDIRLAADLANIYFRAQKDVTDEIEDQKKAILENYGYVIDVGNADATPGFTFRELALGQINEVQAALNNLKAPRLTVNVDRPIR